MRLEGRELLKRIAELLYAAPSEFVQQDVRLRRLGQIHCEPAYCERLVPYLPPPKKARAAKSKLVAEDPFCIEILYCFGRTVQDFDVQIRSIQNSTEFRYKTVRKKSERYDSVL